MSLKSWIVKKAAEKMFTRIWDFMQGKKAYLGGVALMLTGVAEIITGYTNNNGFSSEGWEKIVAGWLAIAAKSALTKKNTEPLAEPAPKKEDLV